MITDFTHVDSRQLWIFNVGYDITDSRPLYNDFKKLKLPVDDKNMKVFRYSNKDFSLMTKNYDIGGKNTITFRYIKGSPLLFISTFFESPEWAKDYSDSLSSDELKAAFVDSFTEIFGGIPKEIQNYIELVRVIRDEGKYLSPYSYKEDKWYIVSQQCGIVYRLHIDNPRTDLIRVYTRAIDLEEDDIITRIFYGYDYYSIYLYSQKNHAYNVYCSVHKDRVDISLHFSIQDSWEKKYESNEAFSNFFNYFLEYSQEIFGAVPTPDKNYLIYY